jgi:hypothetical protein
MTMTEPSRRDGRQTVAMKSMSKEARQLARVIEMYRMSLRDIDEQRKQAKFTGAERGLLDQRRNNLLVTIAALDDRLAAVQGLMDLGRPHLIRVH